MAGMRTSVWAEVRLPGYHRWPDATGRRAYLASLHRHEFRVRAEVEVHHDDRDVEFHDLSDRITSWWWAGTAPDEPPNLGGRSCETVARELVEALVMDGVVAGGRWWRVSVSEDGQAGAVVEAVA